MITGLQLLRSIGQFDYVPAGALQLDRYVLLYAENGRGKTTLAAVLRSLATGDALPIRERRRLAAAHPPHAVLTCSTPPTPVVFEDEAWNHTLQNILIFDDVFVNENVYSGLSVEPSHRQRLHQLVIGARGISLNRELQELVRRIEEHNAALHVRAAAIPTTTRGRLTVDEFCGLPPVPNIDDEIELAERDLAAAQQGDAIRVMPEFDRMALHEFGLAELAETLQRDLPGLDAGAVARVQEHIAALGPDGEAWVADGVPRIVRDANDHDACPFCAQDLTPSRLIGQYRAYFGEEYAALNAEIADRINEIDELHPRDTPARLERWLRIANERRQFWSQFCDVAPIQIDTDSLLREWQMVREGVVGALANKRASPLERQQIPQGVLEANLRLNLFRQNLANLNAELQRANENIRVVKARAAEANLQARVATLDRLVVTRTRHTGPVAALCNEYLQEIAAKNRTAQRRDETRANLQRYREEAFPQYGNAINSYLERFGAGFRIGQVTPADTRGGATCNYDVVINNVPITISGAPPAPGEPSFRTTLSSGDRTSLALAFFLASAERDPDLGQKIVVIDDPLSSLDDQRSLVTAQQIRRLGQTAGQLIVLSHDRGFLYRLWKKLDPAHTSALKIERNGNSSDIVQWEVSAESLTEHDRNHEMLRSYIEGGPDGNERQVAAALRPVLETFLRVAYPAQYPPIPLAMTAFREQCRQNVGTAAEILSAQDFAELNDLVEYANRFHHDPNEPEQEAQVNDGELRGFVQRVLTFTTRHPLP